VKYAGRGVTRPLVLVGVLSLLAPSEGQARNCKPDTSTKDKITKQQKDEWRLFETDLATDAWININLAIGRYGDENRLIVLLGKRSTSPGPSIVASKETAILFGFEDGEPVQLVSDQMVSEAKPDIYGGMNGVIHLVTLSKVVKDEDLAALKASLTTKPLDAVRIVLAGDLTLESSVKKRNSRSFREKLECFFTFAQEKGYMK
jgi:hypothetical protein